jgi:sodium-dependent dicarboxylate transporter 2/3/5
MARLEKTVRMGAGKRGGFIVGAIVCIAMLLIPAPGGLSTEAWRTAAVGSLMAIWWITEALPIPATALIPLVLFPLLGIASMGASAAPFANETIFLFMGGFIIAAAMEACGLHKRIAVAIIRKVGTRPANLIGGFMVATAFISLWVSNTATVVMVLPMASSVITAIEEGSSDSAGHRNFSIALLLGIAYAASIGGVCTLIGTPPTALLAAFMSESYGIQIGFAQWMIVGMPVVIVVYAVAQHQVKAASLADVNTIIGEATLGGGSAPVFEDCFFPEPIDFIAEGGGIR